MGFITKLQVFWIFVNFYIHFGWEMSLFVNFDYLEWDAHPGQADYSAALADVDITGNPAVTSCRSDDLLEDTCSKGWSPYNAFVLAFEAYGEYDKRYRVVRTNHQMAFSNCVQHDICWFQFLYCFRFCITAFSADYFVHDISTSHNLHVHVRVQHHLATMC